jgi:hypothetical protein
MSSSQTINPENSDSDAVVSAKAEVKINPDDLPIPNTLTIFVNTRIRNFSKIRYEPSMTVPKSKSTTVYFNPLIKLNASTASRIPQGYPVTEKYTQFFNKNEFTGLIGRTLASSSQRKLNLVEATEAGYVDNNIRVTLDQLFASNNIFYIKDQPYTIYSYSWNKGDWRIDTKSFEKEFPYIPYGSSSLSYYNQKIGRVTESEAQRELRKLENQSVNLVEGSTAIESWSKFDQKENKLKPGEAKGPPPTTLAQKIDELQKVVKTLPEAAAGVTRNLVYLKLIGEPGNSNFGTNPLTQLIFYQEKDSLKAYVAENITKLGPSYTEMIDSYNQVLREINNYYDLLGDLYKRDTTGEETTSQENIISKKKKYDELSKELNDEFKKYNSGRNKKSTQEILLDDSLKNRLFSKIQALLTLKKEILDLLLKLFKMANDILFFLKKGYYKNTVDFYTLLLETKKKEYKSKKDSEILKLFELTIQFDISCFKRLSATIQEDYTGYLALQKQIETIKNNMDKSTLAEKLKVYYGFPKLLIIAMDDLDVIYFKISLILENAKLAIFESYYNQTLRFLNNEIKTYCLQKIGETRQLLLTQKRKILPNPTTGAPNPDVPNLDDTQLKTSIVLSANAITLFSKISLITMTRENHFYISKLNVIHYMMTLCSEIRNYYVLILQKITGNRRIYKYPQELDKTEDANNAKYDALKPLLPQKILFIEQLGLPFSNPKDFDELIVNIRLFDQTSEHFKNELLSYEFQLRTIVPKYKNRMNDFVPKLSDIAILTNCEELIQNRSVLLNQPYTSNEIRKKWLKDILFDNIDFDTRTEFVEFISRIDNMKGFGSSIFGRGFYDGSSVSDLIYKFNFYKPNDKLRYGGTGDSIFGAITTAFNGTLILNNTTSTNPYAISEAGTLFEGYFKAENLRKAVAENFDEDDLIFLQRNLGDEYAKFKTADISRIKDIMEISEEDGGKFGIPKIIIPLLLKIFKVHIMCLKEFDKNKEPEIGDIVFVKIENKRPLGTNSYVGVIVNTQRTQKNKTKGKKTTYEEVTYYSIKNLSDGTTKDNYKINYFEYIADFNYKVDCELNKTVIDYCTSGPLQMTTQELINMPKIYLFEKNYERGSYYELFYIENKIDEDTIGPLSPFDIVFNTERNEYNNYNIFTNPNGGIDSQVAPDAKDKVINIRKCKKSNNKGESRENKFVVLPKELSKFDVAKNIGDGNCAITAVLLCVYENFQKIFTEEDPDNPTLCLDRSLVRSHIGKAIRRSLARIEVDSPYYNGLTDSNKDTVKREISDFVRNGQYSYLGDEVFQFLSNYFRFNILIYNAVNDNYKYYLFEDRQESIYENKWIIIYQSENHFSPFFKINSAGEYIFQFSSIIIYSILNKITPDQIFRSPGMQNLIGFFQEFIRNGNIVPIDESATVAIPGQSNPFTFIFETRDPNNDSRNVLDFFQYIDSVNCPEPVKISSSPAERPGNPSLAIGGSNNDLYDSDEDTENENENENENEETQIGGANTSVVPKSSYFNVYNSNQYTTDESKLSYYVIIDLELYPGKEGIPTSQKAVLSCQTRYEKIRQSYANLFGLEYRPSEFISSINNPAEKTEDKERDRDRDRDREQYGSPNYFNRDPFPRGLYYGRPE